MIRYANALEYIYGLNLIYFPFLNLGYETPDT